MNVVAHTDPSVFEQLQSEWNDLVQRSCSDTVFSMWEWHRNWWEAYEPGDLWILTVRGTADRLVCIAPFFIEHTDQGRIVRCIGCEDVTDYLDVIADRDCLDYVYDQIAGYLSQNSDIYDEIRICNIPQASPSLTKFSDILKQHGFEVRTERLDVCPVISLPDSWDDYLNNLDKKQRHEIRRKLRRAEGQKQMGGLDWYIVDESSDLEEEMDRFLQLMAASHPEKAEFLEDRRNVRFFKKLVPAMHEAGYLQMNFLRIADEPAAAYLNFDYNNRILVYNSGLDPSRYSRLSPGIILLSYNIQHAIEQGREAFDFLRGDETYKYRMGGEDTAVFSLQIRQASHDQ